MSDVASRGTTPITGHLKNFIAQHAVPLFEASMKWEGRFRALMINVAVHTLGIVYLSNKKKLSELIHSLKANIQSITGFYLVGMKTGCEHVAV